MKLVVLGSGTSVPHAQRASAGFWLETESGFVLLDASAAVVLRMAQESLPWNNLDAIWISHFHLDHCGGLAPFLFGMKWADETQERKKTLRIFGGKGLRQLIEQFDAVGNYRLLEQQFPIEIIELQEEQFEILPGISSRSFQTKHTPQSLSLRLCDQSGRSFVYTSDTGISNGLIEFCGGVRTLLLECSFFRNKPTAKHLELKEAMQIASACEPERLILTHLYPQWDGIDVATEAKKYWSGKTIEARDGLRLEI